MYIPYEGLVFAPERFFQKLLYYMIIMSDVAQEVVANMEMEQSAGYSSSSAPPEENDFPTILIKKCDGWQPLVALDI